MNPEPKAIGIIQFAATAGSTDSDEGEEAGAQQDGQMLTSSATSWHPGKKESCCVMKGEGSRSGGAPLILSNIDLSTKEASVKREPATATTGAVLAEGRALEW